MIFAASLEICMQLLPRSIVVMMATLVLVACGLPQGAGMQGQVLKGSKDPNATFEIQVVTRDSLTLLNRWPVNGPAATAGWIGQQGGASGQIIEPGDKIDLTIWDNEESSLLSSAGQKMVQLSGLSVSSKGTVFLPYADEVYVAKMTPDQARMAITEKMLEIVPSVQVQLNHVPGRKSAVDLVSGVAKPGSYPLPDRNFTLLSLLAQGGGVPENVPNPQVRLVRGGTLYGISMDRLLKNPGLDTTMRGGDKVFVESEERFFLTLGAAGKEAQIAFPQDRVTAIDAMSLTGGLNDNRANPKGILILRDYPASQVRLDGRGPERERVIFALDLTSADGLFSAGQFTIQHRDLVLITESPLNTVNTIFGLIGRAIGLSGQVESL